MCKLSFFVILILFLLCSSSSATDSCHEYDKGSCDTLRIDDDVWGKLVEAPYPDSLEIPIYLWVDHKCMGFMVCLQHDSSGIEFSSVVFSDLVHPVWPISYPGFVIDTSKNTILIRWFDFSAGIHAIEPMISNHAQLLATLYVKIKPDAQPQEIDADTVLIDSINYTHIIVDTSSNENHNYAYLTPIVVLPSPFITLDEFTDVNDSDILLPKDIELYQNKPNPFNSTTQIQFELARSSHVTIEVINLLGKRVTLLVDEYLQAGSKFVNWDGTDLNGEEVASGIYFYRLVTETYSETRKMILLK